MHVSSTTKNILGETYQDCGIVGGIAGIAGSLQSVEVIKDILGIGKTLCGYILIVDALKLTFRKVKLNKRSDCLCHAKK